jgi:polysaccharide export outer membrane protein
MVIVFLFIYSASADAESSANQYTVSVDDILSISVLGSPDLKTMTTVAEDGAISFPYIGTVYVKGMRLSDIEKEITKRLSEGYITYPIVSVSLIKPKGKKFYVYGEVMRPGGYEFEEGMTVVNALSEAGGINPNGIYGTVKLRRKQKAEPGYKDISVDIKGAIEEGITGDIVLQPDDIVIVEANKKFYISGDVARPGEFILKEEMTVVKALSEAGGINPNGIYGKVKVRRKDEGEVGYKDINIDIRGAMEDSVTEDIVLQPNDLVIVEANKKFYIYGAVTRPGDYILKKDMTVVKAISEAGGITPNGIYGKVKVRRKEMEESVYEDISIDIKGIIEGGVIGDIALQPDDMVIVERNKKFYVYGEIMRPGEFILEDNITVLKALSLAGGFTKWGSPNQVKILRQSKDKPGYEVIRANIKAATEGNAAADIVLQPDDTIVVSGGIF